MVACPAVADAAELVSLLDGTFARASEIFARTGTGATGKWVASGDRAIVDIAAYVSGASGKAMLVTGAHTNELTDSDDLVLTGVWTDIGAATVTDDVGDGPNSSPQADRVNFGASGASRIQQSITESNLTDDADYTMTVWARAAADTESFRFFWLDKSGVSDAGVAGTEFTATTTWQRFNITINAGSDVTPSDPVFGLRNDSDALARSIEFWLPNLTEGSYPVPTIRGATPATLAATDWTVAMPEAVRSGAMKFTWVPLFASGEPVSGVYTLMQGSTDVDRIIWKETQGLVRAIDNGSIVNFVGPGFARLTDMVLTSDKTESRLTVSGADSGNGSDTGAAYEWAGGTLYIGQDASNSNHFDGLITAIKRA